MSSYEARRLANIRANEASLKELGLQNNTSVTLTQPPAKKREPAAKRRKLESAQPTRTSARIANSASKPAYADDPVGEKFEYRPKNKSRGKSTASITTGAATPPTSTSPPKDLDSLVAGWSSWVPSAPPPTRDDIEGTYHFPSHPEFRPNKSPEAIIREGSFGGSYWRSLYSSRLRTTIANDWRELPSSWVEGLSVERFLTSDTYDPEVNKYGVACGQSIEAWEAAGWISHEHDVRGWFQWYCRFWMGRRCEDDERQISRWKRCVGETGRWRRTLLKKYVQKGIRTVTDEGDQDDDEVGDVSPVVHQTCHHWAWEVRQEALDRFWEEGR
ncbi:hypothetical protein F5Y15DRAFT_417301 [Xylariaceae sp. FL0016]|nr:hypothetical protein F5Y15DRAFT_417301 [Xylariaceae sp. FL0016]